MILKLNYVTINQISIIKFPKRKNIYKMNYKNDSWILEFKIAKLCVILQNFKKIKNLF